MLNVDSTGKFSYIRFDASCADREVVLCVDPSDERWDWYAPCTEPAVEEFVVPAQVDGWVVKSVEGVWIPDCDTLRFEEGIEHIALDVTQPKGRFRRLVLPATLKSIGIASFARSPALEVVTMPSGVVGSRAFQGCTKLRDVALGEGVPEMESMAFAQCTGLQNIALPDNLRKLSMPFRDGGWIEGGAFEDCTALEHISIGAGLAAIEYNPFTGCSALHAVELSQENAVFEMRGPALVDRREGTLVSFLSSLSEPRYTVDSDIQKVGQAAFAQCDRLRELILPQSVDLIGARAFESCANLQSVVFPGQLKALGPDAFSNCDRLREINQLVVDGSIYPCTFHHCASLERVEIRAHFVCRSAFCDCPSLHSLVMDVDAIPARGSIFDNCPALKDIRELRTPQKLKFPYNI